MAATVQELRDRRANAWARAQEYNQRDGDMSAEDEQAWTRVLDEVDELSRQIELRERTEALDERDREIDADRDDDADRDRRDTGSPTGPSSEQYRDAFVRFCRFGLSSLSPDEQQLVRTGMAQIDGQRAQGTDTGGAGGFTVPQGFWAKVTETLLFYARVMDASESIVTDSGNPLPWPTNNDTANEGELLAENTQVAEQDMVFGQAQLDAYMYSSKMIRVSYQLLQDTGIDLEAFLARKQGERIGRIINRHFTVGTGTGEPLGFVTGATVGVTAAATAAVTYDELVDLEHSVDAAYREGGNCQWAFHDLTFAEIRKLKDGQQRPLWQPSVQAGAPSTFSGYPYMVNNHMAQLALSAKTVAFGDFRAGYATRRVSSGIMRRLEERYADFAQVGFIAFGRYDGVTQDSSAIKVLQQAAA